MNAFTNTESQAFQRVHDRQRSAAIIDAHAILNSNVANLEINGECSKCQEYVSNLAYLAVCWSFKTPSNEDEAKKHERSLKDARESASTALEEHTYCGTKNISLLQACIYSKSAAKVILRHN